MRRNQGITLLKKFFLEQPFVLAVWEAGSSATHRVDEYSDLDLLIITEVDKVELTLDATKQFLENQLKDGTLIRAPEPTWHGFSQFFYIPKDEDLFYFDLSFTNISKPDKFTDIERHGTSNVWFEKQPIYQPTHFEPSKADELCKKVFSSATLYAPIIARETHKALMRKGHVDAISMYQTYLTRFLIPLLNIVYRPNKADFGVRYINIDYPQDVYRRIERLISCRDLDEIQRYLVIAEAWHKELQQTLAKNLLQSTSSTYNG